MNERSVTIDEGVSSPLGESVAAQRPGEGDISKRRQGATALARRLRVGETEEEWKLWTELRNRRLNGFKFSRQVPLGSYVVDFLCRERRLVVEVDGAQHGWSQSDGRRTKFLVGHGYAVLRFWNAEILRERRSVLDTILAALEGRLSPSPGRYAAALSPRGEEAPTSTISLRRDAA